MNKKISLKNTGGTGGTEDNGITTIAPCHQDCANTVQESIVLACTNQFSEYVAACSY